MSVRLGLGGHLTPPSPAAGLWRFGQRTTGTPWVLPSTGNVLWHVPPTMHTLIVRDGRGLCWQDKLPSHGAKHFRDCFWSIIISLRYSHLSFKLSRYPWEQHLFKSNEWKKKKQHKSCFERNSCIIWLYGTTTWTIRSCFLRVGGPWNFGCVHFLRDAHALLYFCMKFTDQQDQSLPWLTSSRFFGRSYLHWSVLVVMEFWA